MTVGAAVVPQAGLNDPWGWKAANYGNLADFFRVEPEPFERGLPFRKPECGVLLHWTLPSGYTRGIQGSPGAPLQYPAVPNRWLVTRQALARARPSAWSYDAWVVASDYVRDGVSETDPGGSPYVRPDGSPVWLGRTWPFAEWPGEAQVGPRCLRPPDLLKATGIADPAFAAFAPNVVDVFGMKDRLLQLPPVDPGPISYTVFGWYADPTADPLYGARQYGPGGWSSREQWRQLMAELRFSVGDDSSLTEAVEAAAAWARGHLDVAPGAEPRSELPARTILHGSCVGVAWQGAEAAHVSGVPPTYPGRAGYVKPDIAVANTAVDGLVALLTDAEVEKCTPPPEKEDEFRRLVTDILGAFATDALDVLDRADSEAQLELRRQASWFGASSGGTTWSVVIEAEDGTGTSEPELTTEQSRLLARLRLAQARIDAHARAAQSHQRDLYDLWWKGERWNSWSTRTRKDEWKQAVNRALPNTASALAAEVAAGAVWTGDRDDAAVALSRTLGEMRLKAAPGAPLLKPVDPVLMVKGTGRKLTSDTEGLLGDDLRCRFTGQTISGMDVRVSSSPLDIRRTDPPDDLPSWAHPDLPTELADLLVEAFFLDSSNAPLIAAAVDAGDRWRWLGAVRQTQAWLASGALQRQLDQVALDATFATMYGLGEAPARAALRVWEPPWAPLYMDWQIEWVPGASDPEHALDEWRLPLSGGSHPLAPFLYQWTGDRPEPPMVGAKSASGRIVLTPQATDLFAARIVQLLDDPNGPLGPEEDLWALRDALDYVRRADVLAQAVDGFHRYLVQGDATLVQLPPPDSDAMKSLTIEGTPPFAPVGAPVPMIATNPQLLWNPIRAGHLAVRKLEVVDTFGQVFDVISARVGDNALVLPPDCRCDNPAMAELKPRVVQPLRLRLELLDAESDDRPVALVPDANPLCGWVVADRFADGIFVYDAEGELLGEVLVAQGGALWAPPPDRRAQEITNPHLRAVVDGMLDSRASATAAGELRQLMDDALWTMDPTGGWSDPEMTALLGRPLAVVRASIALELDGVPVASQAWEDTGKEPQVTGGFERVAFPVGLGSAELLDDGLVGFWLDDDYSHIDSATGLLEAPGSYVREDRPRVAAAGVPALLTLLVEPSRKVHAISGILPPSSITVPERYFTTALDRLRAAVRVGPVLMPAGPPAMPLPVKAADTWRWLERPGPSGLAEPSTLVPATAVADLPDAAPTLREGWWGIDLTGPPTRLTYSVTPLSVPVAFGEIDRLVALEVTGYNATGGNVPCSSIQVALPVGVGPTHLTASPNTIVASVRSPAGWSATNDGAGTITATGPRGAGVPAGTALTIVLEGVAVNRRVGRTALTVTETADQERELALAVEKVNP